MERKIFTPEEKELLRQSPYVYKVTDMTVAFTKEFKERFIADHKAGKFPREIFTEHGFDLDLLGRYRIDSISYQIRYEYNTYGGFVEGRRKHTKKKRSRDGTPLTEAQQIKQLSNRVDYLEQQVEFLKKISSIRDIGK